MLIDQHIDLLNSKKYTAVRCEKFKIYYTFIINMSHLVGIEGANITEINFYTRCMQAAGPSAPGFLKLLWFVHQYVCVSVYVSTPERIYQWHDME